MDAGGGGVIGTGAGAGGRLATACFLAAAGGAGEAAGA
ncbi:PE-PGRS family protein, partial [Bradyrhizobium sp. Leo170]